jgi:hypothetical protein
VRPILATVPVAASVLVALASAGAICATVLGAGTAAAGQVRPARTVAAGPVRHIVLVGVPGLLRADVSAAATPALWRLARQGSVGSLSVTGSARIAILSSLPPRPGGAHPAPVNEDGPWVSSASADPGYL